MKRFRLNETKVSYFESHQRNKYNTHCGGKKFLKF